MKNHMVSQDEFPKVPYMLEGISPRFLRESLFVPVSLRGGVLTVITPPEPDGEALDALEIASGVRIERQIAEPTELEEYLERIYSQNTASIDKIIEDIRIERPAGFEDEEEDVGHLKDLASEAPIIKLVNLVISRAVESRASDVHIEPYEDELRVRYRIDGVLHETETAPKRLQAAIISRIKIMARLNIAERRLPQDGRIQLGVGDREIDLRVSTVPTIHGESVVMRILDRTKTLTTLPDLGLDSNQLAAFRELIGKPNGIVLVTGPTGSGKTTTLYGALDELRSPELKIITVEDPVEYQLTGINQIPVKPKIGLSFANTLRHIVRQDPDIIMIGEIRDLETAEIAIQSALTGHLVFSTLHTNDAPSAITRLLDMGVEGFLLSSTLRGVLAQRLVRVICPECRRPDPGDTVRPELPLLGLPQDTELFYGTGCPACGQTGFLGRHGIFEFLVINNEIRTHMLKNPDAATLKTVSRKAGMRTLLEDGARKVAQGVTTVAEVLRVTQED